MDLRDLAHNTSHGIHMASLAGSWLALICGFGGMRDHDGHLSFNPQLPDRFNKLSFALHWRGCKVRVEITKQDATYTLDCDVSDEIELTHSGETFTLKAGSPVTKPLKPVKPLTPEPTQPVGLAPGLGRFTDH